ncbi:hypothetical protein O988_02886 [Pseudogymnoascus sp. VKM F-3808]|nr:hypothetical protein O988_02886 [Pseudogymnoascus sp. VKM F-3808]
MGELAGAKSISSHSGDKEAFSLEPHSTAISDTETQKCNTSQIPTVEISANLHLTVKRNEDNLIQPFYIQEGYGEPITSGDELSIHYDSPDYSRSSSPAVTDDSFRFEFVSQPRRAQACEKLSIVARLTCNTVQYQYDCSAAFATLLSHTGEDRSELIENNINGGEVVSESVTHTTTEFRFSLEIPDPGIYRFGIALELFSIVKNSGKTLLIDSECICVYANEAALPMLSSTEKENQLPRKAEEHTASRQY